MKKIMESSKKYIEPCMIIILALASALVSFKSIFIDFGFDDAYSVAMSYRHLSGDRMFLEMWEPHQSSIFIIDFLMLIYRIFVPSLEGVSLYLNVCGTLLFVGLAFFFYREVKTICDKYVAFASALFLIIYRIKATVLPEFANLSVFFSILTLLLLVKFLKNNEKILWLILASLSLCLWVLAYPACVVGYAGVLLILVLFSKNRLKNSLIMTGVCAVTGAVYICFFAFRIGIKKYYHIIKYIVNGDTHITEYTSDTGKLSRMLSGSYFYDFLIISIYALIILAVLLLVKLVARLIFKKSITILPAFSVLLFVADTVVLLIWRPGRTPVWRNFWHITPMILVLAAVFFYKKADTLQKRFWLMGLILSSVTMIAGVVFSDLHFLYITPYLVLAGAVSFILIANSPYGKIVITAFLLLAIIRRAFYAGGYSQIDYHHTVLTMDTAAVTEHGPNKWLRTDSSTAAKENAAYYEFRQNLLKDDKAFYAGMVKVNYIIDPACMIMMNCEISNPSTIDTPIYNDVLNNYYEINPDKFPTVIVLDSVGTEEDMAADPYIIRWMGEQGFTEVTYGQYYRFYRRP